MMKVKKTCCGTRDKSTSNDLDYERIKAPSVTTSSDLEYNNDEVSETTVSSLCVSPDKPSCSSEMSACKQAIPIESLQDVGEDSANIFGLRVPCSQHNEPSSLLSQFSRLKHYLFIQVAPHLSSRVLKTQDWGAPDIISSIQVLCPHSQSGTLLQHLVLKTPYAIEEVSTDARKKADYIVNNLHGITWDSGDVDYSLLESLISRATTRAETIYVKGEENKKFLVKYTSTPIVDLFDRGCSSLKTLKFGRNMCMAHSSVWNFCSAPITWGLRDRMIEDGHAHHQTCAENKPVAPFCTVGCFPC
uniref:Uncharacterized protein n=1 Tax=Timema shepardi TaxID=629360 RepID=A0A7R9B0G0_TIMSH|nr:unnamed protein product [Timema shepardi]